MKASFRSVTRGPALSLYSFKCRQHHQALKLPFRCSHSSIFWSGTQANIHALLHPPDILMLQLDRFCSDKGRVFKRQDEVEVNREIMMPFFADHQLYIELAHYRLLATITHHGAHPRTGHYTACLHAEGSLWSCDDNRNAVSVQDFSASHAQGCYLLFYEKIS